MLRYTTSRESGHAPDRLRLGNAGSEAFVHLEFWSQGRRDLIHILERNIEEP